MEIKKDLSPNFTTPQNSVAQYGVPRSFKHVVLHWWGKPEDNPTLQGTVNYLKRTNVPMAERTSTHYVVSDETIIQLVLEENIAWHARQANPISIGIEIDPKFPGKTYNTVGWLVNDICKRRNIPLDSNGIKVHKDFVATACPGTLDVKRVIALANGGIESIISDQDIPSFLEDKHKLKDHEWYSKYWTLDEFIQDSIKTHAKYDQLQKDLGITTTNYTIALGNIKAKQTEIDRLQAQKYKVSEAINFLVDAIKNGRY